MKSKVIIVNQSTGYLMVDVVNAYSQEYDEVVLLAGKVEEHSRILSPKVFLYNIKAYNKKNVFYRILTWLISFFQSFFYLLIHGKGAMVVYVTNPPLSYFSSLFLRNKFIIIEYDIYPDALKNIGIRDDSLIFKLWTKINRKVFKKADCIITLSNGMANLLSKYVNKSKIKVIPNWGSITMNPVPKVDNPFIKEHHLEGKFVVMYSGNIGYTHHVETIVALALLLRNEFDIHFMVIGGGGKKADLVKLVEMQGLVNCTFLDWLPAGNIVYSLSAADLSVVTLTDDTAFVSVPSKTYNILSVGSPMLCVAPEKSEIGQLVKKERCGKCYDKDHVEEMINFILQLKSDKKYYTEMVKNALNASTHYTFANANEYVYHK